MPKIEAVIFDWGGVLIEDPGPPMIRYIAEALGVSQQQYLEMQLPYIGDFRIGKITEELFWQRLCGELGVAVPKDSLWAAAFEKAYQPKADVFALARKLRGEGLKVGLLSNTEMPAVDFFYKQGYDFFDVVVFSCVEGTKKPKPEIYELTLAKLACQAGEAVFIDDRQRCVESATATGLNAILFEDASQVKAELARLGVTTD
ncbi:MAG: HAD family hydrolase [Planctomycetota bacterium]|jgi:putative hydrolase of the HAD superfamily